MLNSDRPVGFSTAHCQLALDEGADIAALEVVDDIDAVLLSLEPFLNEDAPIATRLAGRR